MTRQQIVELFADRQQLWDRRDVAGLTAGHAEDGVVISPIFGTVTGRDAIEASYHDLLYVFEDWSLVGKDLLVDGDKAAQVFIAQATHTHDLFGVAGTGRRFEIHGVLIYELEDGRIKVERRFYDFTAMLVQLGVLKARA